MEVASEKYLGVKKGMGNAVMTRNRVPVNAVLNKLYGLNTAAHFVARLPSDDPTFSLSIGKANRSPFNFTS